MGMQVFGDFGSFRARLQIPGRKHTGGDFMRLRSILALTTLFMTCFTLAVFAQPLPRKNGEAGTNRPPENQSVSGQISAVGDAAFSVSTKKDNSGQQTVEFLVDDKTKVEGKLTIGAQALVEYRSDSGKNIAVHVVVTPASGVGPY
jgi:hypothetical protein